MGGLIARYACGKLFDPESKTICGLQPGVYYSLATPHLGLSLEEGPAEAPYLAAAGSLPVVGSWLRAGLKAAGRLLASIWFGRTGRQFLGLDGGAGGRGGYPWMIG